MDKHLEKLGRFVTEHQTNTTLLALFLIVILCFASALLSRSMFEPVVAPDAFDMSSDHISFQSIYAPQHSGKPYYFVWPKEDKAGDIYKLVVSTTQTYTLNLTQTPNHAELWPVPAPVDERLAFFALSATKERSLRVMEPGAAVMDVTYDVGESGLGDTYQIDLSAPPQWSPDGKWIAFLGHSTDETRPTVELFVTEVSKSKVRRLTEGDNVVVAFSWVEADRLFYAITRADASLVWYEIVFSPEPSPPVLLKAVEP